MWAFIRIEQILITFSLLLHDNILHCWKSTKQQEQKRKKQNLNAVQQQFCWENFVGVFHMVWFAIHTIMVISIADNSE